MNDERVRDLIAEVAQSGGRLSLPLSGPDLRGVTRGAEGREAPNRKVRPGKNGPPKWKGRFGLIAAFAALLVVAVPIVVAVALVAFPASNSHHNVATPVTKHKKSFGDKHLIQQSAAQVAVSKALVATQSASNFDLSFQLNGGSGMGAQGVKGEGAVQLSPTYAMTLNNVLGASLAFGPNNAWEALGSPTDWNEYTLPAFGSYAAGVVGSEAGALGTLFLSGPTGLLDLSGNEIGTTTEIGSGVTVNGESTTEFQVSIDPASLVDARGVTPGEQQAIENALSSLGTSPITDDIYVDSSGYIVQTLSEDGAASLQVDLSNFDSAGTVTLPGEQSRIDSQVSLNVTFMMCSGVKEMLALPDTAQNRALQKELVTQSCGLQQQELQSESGQVQGYEGTSGVSSPITTVTTG